MDLFGLSLYNRATPPLKNIHFLKSILLILHTKMMLEYLIIFMMFVWIVFSLTSIKRQITGPLNERKPSCKSTWSLEMKPLAETDPLISLIPEPATDSVFDEENLLPDCRLRIPKTTITELDEVTDKHGRESMNRPIATHFNDEEAERWKKNSKYYRKEI